MSRCFYFCLMFIWLACAVVGTALNAYDILTIDDAHIALHCQKLTSELRMNMVMRAAGYTSLAVGTGALLWYIGAQKSAPLVAATPLPIHAGNSVAQVPPQIIKTQIERCPYHCPNPNESSLFGLKIVYNWLKSQMNQVVVLLIFKGLNDTLGPLLKPVSFLNGIASKTINYVYHENNLEWYIESHTKIPVVLNELEAQAGILGGKLVKVPHQGSNNGALTLAPISVAANDFLIDPADRQHHCDALVAMWNCLVADLESLLGFFEYRKEQTVRDSVLVVKRITAIQEQIIKYVQEAKNELEEALANNQDTRLLDTITQFRARLNIEAQSYKALESL